MRPAQVLCGNAGMKAAIENRIAAYGFAVERVTDSDLWTTRSETTLHLTAKADAKLRDLDESFLGTPDYMGLVYFWNYEYRHYLRSANPETRCLVHDAFLKAGLALDGESTAHEEIVIRLAKG